MRKEEQKEKKNRNYAIYTSTIAICTVMALLLFLTANTAALVVEKGIGSLTSEADAIVLGNVTALQSQWEDGKIFTYVTLSAREYIKGAKEGEIIIKVPGGTVGEISCYVTDTPTFEKGEEVLTFLREKDNYFDVVGCYQGKYAIEDNKVLGTGLSVDDFAALIRGELVSQQGIEKGRPGPLIMKVAQEVFNLTTAEEVITPENESKLIINESKINVKSSSPGWETILDEGFPLGWPSGKWSRSGKSPCRYTWDEDDYKPYQGTYSAWCADISLGGCSDLDPSRDNYPNDMDGWMKYGPFDLSDATDARMTFYYWSQTESNFYDYFFYGASHDGSSFSGTRVSGYSGGWRSKTLDLSGYCGDSSVWVGFKFHSGSSITYKGTFVDEVIIQKCITTVPTPVITGIDPPQPTASPTRQWITILGSGFVSDSKVTLRIGSNTYPIPSSRTEFKSSTKIRVYVGLTDPDTWTAQVTNPGNRLSNIFSFTVKPPISTPVITSITPSYGPAKAAQLGSDVAASDSTRVTVIGSNFGTSQGYVKFWQDGTTYHNAAIESWSNSQIVCRVPGGVSSYNKPDGTGNVYVSTSDGRTSSYAHFRVTYSYGGGKWTGNSVTYRANPNTADCTGEEVAVQAAANTWNNAGANFRFVYGGTTSKTSVGSDGENSVIWKNYGYTNWIARAWTYRSTSNPKIILENDLEFNDYYTWSASLSCPSGKYDVQNIATHEFGHWLNLKDIYGTMDSEKTMYGRGASCETKKRTLESDDIAGIVYIYGSSPSSSLTVNVKNTAGYNLPSCGGKIEVMLYDENYKPVETKSKTYSGGESSVQVKFDNLVNDKYYIEVYQTPNAGLKLSEFWGGDEVTVSGSTTKDFVRHTQWVYDVKVEGKSPYGNEIKVNLYEIVHVDVTIKNDEGGSTSKNVKASVSTI